MAIVGKAEGTGFDPAVFRKFCNDGTLQFNCLQRLDLSPSSYFSSFPVVSGCGGAPPGQNRDKFIFAGDTLLARLGSFHVWGTDAPPTGKSHWWICFIMALGTLAGRRKQVNSDEERRLPRPPRQARRRKEVIGLPSDAELQKLATEFLTIQRKNFPELARQGLLPLPTAGIVAEMVENFKLRHGGAVIDPERLASYRRLKMKFGGSYARYSCDNSKPSSILDQTRNNLNKAASEKRFIPWE